MSVENKRKSAINQLRWLGLTIFLGLAGCQTAPIQLKPLAMVVDQKPFPACFSKVHSKAERFEYPDAFSLVLSDGLLKLEPKELYKVSAKAAKNRENYKALFFARIVTMKMPEKAGTWENRAKLAASLGFAEEAKAAKANALNPSSHAYIPPNALPGKNIVVKPSSFSDWAALMSLIAWDTSRLHGNNAIQSVQNDVSGISVISSDDVVGKKINIGDVSNGLFHIKEATPMVYSDHNSGDVFMGLLSAGLAAYSVYDSTKKGYDASEDIAAMSHYAGSSFASAKKVASVYEGGSILGLRYEATTAVEVEMTPKPSGKRSATGYPISILWASGNPFSPYVKAEVFKHTDNGVEGFNGNFYGKNSNKLKYMLDMAESQFNVPRLMSFCKGGKCSVGASALEVLLNKNDIDLLITDKLRASRVKRYLYDWSDYNEAYQKGEVTLNTGYKDAVKGESCYQFSNGPSSWLVPQGTKLELTGGDDEF